MLELGIILHRKEADTTNSSSWIFFLNADLNLKYIFKNTARDEAFASVFIVELQIRNTPLFTRGQGIFKPSRNSR